MTPHSEEAFQDEQNVIQTGVPLIGKEEMEVWPDRPPTWISTTKMPLIDIHGKCIGTFGISRDITDLKNTLNELMKAKEDAEQSNRLKTAFLHNISHEIRTPLNAIIGFSSILCTGKLSASKKKQFAQIIQVSNDQLLSIISGILALASLETGHEQVTEKRTHLNELMKNVYDQFTINLNNDKVSFGYYCELPDILCEVLTDSVKLMQIIINLVGNALKFTKEGYVKFGYQIINEKIRFYVEDSGIGIPEHLHDQIFNRFVQADNSSTRKYGGAGLGLSLVKGYLQIMDGSIHLTSQPGVGSNFTFYIPYKPAAPKIMPETGKRLYPLKDISPNQDILIAENDRI
jgi:signal transduction histidine kinase